MKYIKKIPTSYWVGMMIFAVVSTCFYACKDDSADLSLGSLPKADFSIEKGKDANTMILINKTNMPSIAYWSTSNGQHAKGDSASLHFIFKGTYTVNLLVAAKGGLDSTTKEVTITQNDPTACQGTVQGFIAGCSQKTWTLNPDAGAEGVGPNAGDVTWWSNTAADVTGARVCDFNDTWTFHFNATGTMDYDNKGDFFTEGYLGKANNSCGVNADLTDVQKPWASGEFRYEIIKDNGTKPDLGQLKVIGLGAHIGFPRVTNGADNQAAPVQSITYDIISMKQDPAGYDLLTLAVNESSDPSAATWWTFTLRSVN